MSRVRFAAPVVLLLAAAAHAQPPRTRDITPADYASVAAITDFALSPDGKYVAYCEARWDEADDARKTDLWVVAADGKSQPRRLTGDRANDRKPKWSADGEAVFVLGNRKRAGETKAPYDGTTQVWRAKLVPVLGPEIPDREGAPPQPLTKAPGGVTGYDHAPNAGALFYATDSSATDDDEFAKLRAKYGTVSYGHGKRTVSELWRLDTATWRTEKVWAKGRYVRDFAATRDGKRIGMISSPDDTVIKSEGQSTVDVWEVETDKTSTPADVAWRKNQGHTPFAWLDHLAWNPAGDKLAFNAVYDAHPTEIHVIARQGDGWGISKMPRRPEVSVKGYGSPLKWTAADTLGYLAEVHGTVDLLEQPAGAAEPRAWTGHGAVVSGFDVGANGQRVLLAGGGGFFPDLFATTAKTEGKGTQLTRVHAHTAGWKLPTVRHVTWKAPDGAEVGGVLELPAGYKKGDRLPLVVGIHGGPTTSTKAELVFDPHNGRLYFAAAGYAALYPNYRGSTGYGDKFVTDLIGRENDIEVNDIVAGVQHLVKEGIADPDRVAVMGWSNGGYLTNCLITRKNLPFKLKAASSGAGIVDTVAEWGFNDEPAYPVVFKKGLPWQQPDVYRKTSPTYDLGNVTTPTLVHVGGGDERCPPGHSRMLYRALKENLNVPTQLLEYPGEPHGLTKLSNRRAKMEWDLAWFEKFLRK